MSTPDDGHDETDTGRADAIVIGSGFGGAVAAARLAQAGLSVVVLERGRRWRPGDFPRNTEDLNDRWLWGRHPGLYDVRWLDSMISVQAAGWGGGSLIYANVFSRPSTDTFSSAWPAGYSRQSLDPYFDLVAHMLEVRPIATNPHTGRYPARTVAMEAMAGRMSRAHGTVRPLLAVNFNEPGEPAPNRHGQVQSGCTFIGECVLGCNVGAKNSLDHNYLAVAEHAGARVETGMQATAIRATEAGYEVTVQSTATSSTRVFRARQVFVAAGAVGTTELLLRSRDVSGGLRALSRTLGDQFSGNGDYLAFIRGKHVPSEPDDGPTITTTTIVDFDHDGRRTWFQAQDGGYPRLIAELIASADPTRAPRRRLAASLAKSLATVGLRIDSVTRTPTNRMTMLLMGRDSASGRLVLDKKNEARLVWPYRDNRRLYTAEAQVVRRIASALRGRMVPSPAWRFLRQAVTVHNLGGVPMGRDHDTGVVDATGEVHGYPGLYVVDGAVIPTATGVNPSATIAAVAERNVEHAIRRIIGDEYWQAPERDDVKPGPVPEDTAFRAVADTARKTSGGGVAFRERLRGAVIHDGERRSLVLVLSCALPGWNDFITDSRRRLVVTGTARISGVPAPLTVTGTLSLFAVGSGEAMRYSLRLRSEAEGTDLQVEGRKLQRRGNPLALWPDLTRLRLWLRDSDSEWTRGYARIGPVDVIRLAASIHGEAFTVARRVISHGRFLAYFAGGAIDGFLGHRSGHGTASTRPPD